MRVAPAIHALRGSGWGEAVIDRDSEAPAGPAPCRVGEARERRSGKRRSEVAAGLPWQGKTQGSCRPATREQQCRPNGDDREGRAQKSHSPGPARRLRREKRDGQTARGFARAVTHGRLAVGKAPKGEPHERCRHETRPTRLQRVQAAGRATKPWGRNEAGEADPRGVNLCCRHVLKRTEAHERSRSA